MSPRPQEEVRYSWTYQAIKFVMLDFDQGWDRTMLVTGYANIRYTATKKGAKLAVAFEGGRGCSPCGNLDFRGFEDPNENVVQLINSVPSTVLSVPSTVLTLMLSITAGLYNLFVIVWFCCYLQWRDSVWWLALLNALAPLFFAPILIYFALGIIAPSIAAWIGVVVPALIFLYFYGSLFWFNPSLPAETAGDPVTIMTFNIWWHSRSDQTAQVITQNGSIDVAALQELREHMAQHLIDAWSAHYPYRLVHTGTGTPRLGIFSRYPLIPVATDHLAAFNFRIQAARVIAPAGEFLLYNVHPRAMNFREYIYEHKSIAREAAHSIQMQLRHIEDLLRDIDSQDQPVVVVGDFNCTPQSTVYARLLSQLVDGHRSAGWGFGHTFPAHGKGLRGLPVPFPFMRLDMLFHSKELVTLHSRVGKRHGDSDHFPVITTLTWQAPQPETQGS